MASSYRGDANPTSQLPKKRLALRPQQWVEAETERYDKLCEALLIGTSKTYSETLPFGGFVVCCRTSVPALWPFPCGFTPSRVGSERLCLENRWEYSSANTRLQIDRPKQIDA